MLLAHELGRASIRLSSSAATRMNPAGPRRSAACDDDRSDAY
jgi:hypothetical protein